MRITTNLAQNWKFCLDEQPYAFYAGYDDSEWQPVTLPHDWAVESPFDESYSSGTGYARGGVGWYRLRFHLPDDIPGKTVRVNFGGVYKNARTWCNSNYLGMRPCGYTSVTHDITPFARAGENVIAVRVEHNDLADSRWYTGNGIYRDVTLEVLDPMHFVKDGVFVHCVDKHTLQVQWELSADADVAFTLDGKTVNGSGKTGNVQLHMENPKLWSPNSPALYSLICQVTKDGQVCDELTIACGFRTVKFDANTGFWLNGVNMKLKGVCLHHDAGALGAAVPKEIWRRRLQKLKACGCNAIRTAHNPPDTHLLDLCDEMGFVVMNEAFDEWEGCKNKWWQGHNVYPPKHFGYSDAFPNWHAQDLRNFVRRDRNHPSIILWSVGNEIDYPNDPYCHPLFKTMTGNNDANKPAQERQYDPNKPNAERLAQISARLVEIVKQHDPTRPVTAAIAFPELANLVGYPQTLDVVGYNYKEHLYRDDRAAYPHHVIYGSENGHEEEQWLAVRDNDDICGQFLWTGVDYLGEAQGWPVRLSPAGLLTTAGFEKPRYHHRRAMWADELVAHVEPCGTVYTNAKQVELFCDGQSLGMKDLEGYSAAFELPGKFQVLRAVAMRGNERVEVIYETPGELAAIELHAEQGDSVVQVTVSLRDAQGQLVTDDVPITCTLQGGELLGIDNGVSDDLTPYRHHTRSTHMGQAIVYVRANSPAVLRVSCGEIAAQMQVCA
ncbi:MAG: DUF4982 domain-containing protein [Oscillospiraceae bacterium]|nr:DUF4982 domain-containing protein [Oscillospiraceae bacterium]